MSRPLVIAVDGPAASGKGTIAQGLAEHYGLPCLDTGMLYRAVGVLTQRRTGGLEPSDAEWFARSLAPDFFNDPDLRTRHAGELASRVAAYSGVRAALLEFQRAFAARPDGAVLDGRDIGTVIAPDAVAKLFVTARPEVRAERRWRQLNEAGERLPIETVLEDIRVRDQRDMGRASAPLARAPDAVLLDTSEMSIDEAADAARRIVELARLPQA
ncbi:MAG TPA: d(CMP) kinase [Caulobacteraceae bacterium]|nr:d(CMP) kinase [Caulobacteraceae bacterium]